MALTQAQLDGATNWLDTQWGGGFGSNGVYQPGAYQFDPSNMLANYDILGAGQSMGYGNDDIAQILALRGGNVTGDQIGAFGQQHAGAVDMGRQLFESQNGYDENVSSDPFYNPPPTVTTSQSSQFSAPSLNGYTKNPYLDQMASGLRDQFTQFRDDGLAANRGNAVAMGNVGGSRQGIAEARTMTDAGKGYDSAIANLYGQDYNNQMNRNLQQYGVDTNAYLTNQGQQLGFYGDQRRLDQSGAALGASLYGLANNGDWSGLNSASNIYNQYSGLGGSSTTGGESGGGGLGFLGGAGAAYQMYRGLFGNGS